MEFRQPSSGKSPLYSAVTTYLKRRKKAAVVSGAGISVAAGSKYSIMLIYIN